jgi:hypothetical protein
VALKLFVPVWEVLDPSERARILRLLIEQVDLDSDSAGHIVTHPEYRG